MEHTAFYGWDRRRSVQHENKVLYNTQVAEALYIMREKPWNLLVIQVTDFSLRLC